jgi:hypothetical protein
MTLIKDLDLSAQVIDALHRNNIFFVEQLINTQFNYLPEQVDGIDKNTANEITEIAKAFYFDNSDNPQ